MIGEKLVSKKTKKRGGTESNEPRPRGGGEEVNLPPGVRRIKGSERKKVWRIRRIRKKRSSEDQ